MKILIASQSYDPRKGGQAVFVARLAGGLVRAGHQVTVLTPAERFHSHAVMLDGVPVTMMASVPLFPPYTDVRITPFSTAAAGRVLDRLAPDVVHLQDHYPLCRSVLRAARRRGLPMVGTNHYLPETQLPYMPALLRRWPLVERIMWQLALQVLNQMAVSTAPTATNAHLLREQGLRIRTEVISNGVDLQRFHPDPEVDRAAVRQRYGLSPERVTFLYVGRVERDKRVDLLLEAVRRLGRGDVQLVVAGQGHGDQEMQALAGRLRLNGQVHWVGFLPNEALPALLNSIDVFCLPSSGEVQSLATLEAMAVGKPILASDAGALPELVVNDVNGYLFRSGDVAQVTERMAELADHPERWSAMAAASRALAQRHDLARTIAAYEEVYRSVVGEV